MGSQSLEAGKHKQTENNNATAHTACRKYRALKQYKKRLHYHTCLNSIESTFRNNRGNMWKVISSYDYNNSFNNIPSPDAFYSHFASDTDHLKDMKFDLEYEKTAIMFLKDSLNNSGLL